MLTPVWRAAASGRGWRARVRAQARRPQARAVRRPARSSGPGGGRGTASPPCSAGGARWRTPCPSGRTSCGAPPLPVARMCQDRMHELVVDAYKKAVSGKEAAAAAPAWKDVMEKGFARMDDEATIWAKSRTGGEPACRCELQTPARCDHVGSTAVVAVVGPNRVVVANSGDSRAVLCRAGVPVPLSVDHKPDRPDELERIKAAGGRVIYWDGARVLGVLAMSRAIGDGYLKPYVTSEPEVTVTERADDDECLILASDGLWDVVTNEMACEVVRACFRSNGPPSPPGCSRPKAVLPPPAGASGGGGGDAVVKGVDKAESDKACADAALLLAKLAIARRSADNVSVVVVDLRRPVP
ncbi:probable protein phosphatase 2C 49 isoform X1 [Oryza sativa Japonica Group]|uniref:probable protein phosphatase 2C 49 isoform X1 n=1 Tax=Oryza sativa subsp. japonica TaxID=39947 RepID=UPI00264430A9